MSKNRLWIYGLISPSAVNSAMANPNSDPSHSIEMATITTVGAQSNCKGHQKNLNGYDNQKEKHSRLGLS